MPTVAVALLYIPPGGGGEFRIAMTTALEAVRVVGEVALAEAQQSVNFWHGLDPDLALMRQAEVDRLRRVLSLLLPGIEGHQ